MGGDGRDAFIVDNEPATRDFATCGRGFDWVAADRKGVVARDCERVYTGPDAGRELDQELVEEEFLDGFIEDLALSPEDNGYPCNTQVDEGRKERGAPRASPTTVLVKDVSSPGPSVN